MRSGDVIVIQETFVEEKNMKKVLSSLDKKYTWHGKTATRAKNAKRGRGAGGQIVGVKKSLNVQCEIEQWEYGLKIDLKKKNSEIRYIILTGYNNRANNLNKFVAKLSDKMDELEGSEARIIVSGDINARIGEEQGIAHCGLEDDGKIPTRKSEDKELRPEGKLLLRWCEERAMIVMNGRSEGDEDGKITSIGHGLGLGSILDLVLVKMEEMAVPTWFKGLRVTAQEGSDHLPVLYRLEWGTTVEQNRKNSGRKQKKLRWKERKANLYIEEWRKEWDERRELEVDEAGVEAKWSTIKKTILKTAEKVGMITGGTHSTSERNWDNGQYRVMRRKMFKLLHRFRKVRDWSSKIEYLNCRKKLAALRDELIKEWLDEKRREVAESKNITEWWKAMSWFRRRKKIANNDISKEEWQEHFYQLLKGPEIEAETVKENDRNMAADEIQEEKINDGLNDPLKSEEIELAIRNMKAGKAAGEDGIAAEFLKNLPECGHKELIELIKEIWEKGKIIEEWTTATIFPIHKSGNENDIGNYRGISLLDIGYKILASVMAKRLGEWLEKEKKLVEAQAGFRSKKGTMEQIFILNTIIGMRLNQKGGRLYTVFIDFKKAFDTVNRERLWTKMKQMGISGKYLEMVKELYKNTWNQVIAGEEMSGKFKTTSGVRQGCPLSPILFNIYINDLEETLRKRREGGSGFGGSTGLRIFALLYADDAVLVAECGEELDKMLKTLEKWSTENLMEVNVGKTKILIFNNGGPKRQEKWVYKGETIEIVNEFKYLGFWFTTKNQYNTHARKCAGKTQQLVNKVWGETKRAEVTDLKMRLFLMESTVKVAALYGVELWGWSRRELIEKVQSRYVKASMGLSRNTPDYLWKLEAGKRSIEVEATKRAGKFMIKLLRMEDNSWPKRCLMEEVRGITNRIPTKWGKELMEALKRVGNGELVEKIWKRSPIEEIERSLESIVKTKENQDVQKDWIGVDNSTYCSYYKLIKDNIVMGSYWQRKDLKGWQKETWARWRCGNVTKEGKKGHINQKCRSCGKDLERIEHVICCEKVIEKLSPESKEWWRVWREGKDCDQWRNKLIENLNGNAEKSLCCKLREIEKTLIEANKDKKV